MSGYDSMVLELRSKGIPLDKAESAARHHYGLPAVDPDPADDARLEKAIETAGDRIMQALGFCVIRLSQARASKLTPGVPDRRYYHRGRKLALWWEAKSGSGHQRPAQREFQHLVEQCGEIYVLGTDKDLAAWLYEHGVARRDQETGLPVPLLYPPFVESVG